MAGKARCSDPDLAVEVASRITRAPPSNSVGSHLGHGAEPDPSLPILARTSEAGAGVETNRRPTSPPAVARDTVVRADSSRDSSRALTHQPPTASLPDTGSTPWDRIAELLIELALEHDPAIIEPVSRSRPPR